MVKKIFYINSEMEPFASVSNLANLSVDIPLGLQDQGNDVRCLMPKYGFISERKYILREVIRLKEIYLIIMILITNVLLKVLFYRSLVYKFIF